MTGPSDSIVPKRRRPRAPALAPRRCRWALLAVLAVAALGGTLVTGLRPGPEQATATSIASASGPATRIRDEPAPALAGRTLRGEAFDLAALRGRVVLVNVWASWCDPCRRELPQLAGAARRWSGAGLRLVGLDIRDDDGRARALLAEVGAGSVTVVADPTGTLAVTWGVVGVPETFLVDRAGRVRVWARGAVTAEWLEQRIPPLLAA
jgi:cytochrome c biogenesis protein CcmG/thiol:disulfide interchange protein DsbE